MKVKVRNILLCTAAAMAVAAVGVLYSIGARRCAAMECSGIRVTVKDSTVNRFVDGNDVKRILASGYGDLAGLAADSIRTDRIERILEGKSVIRDCQAYFTKDGLLNIDISQRTPVARFQTGSNGWYADADGYVFPLQRSYTSMVPVVDGEFPVKVERGFKGMVEDKGQREWLMRTVGMVEYMNSGGWERRISQIHVHGNGEIRLVPAEGKETFLLGQPVKIAEKFNRIEKYYGTIKPLKKEYREIDLRFDGQIVCR